MLGLTLMVNTRSYLYSTWKCSTASSMHQMQLTIPINIFHSSGRKIGQNRMKHSTNAIIIGEKELSKMNLLTSIHCLRQCNLITRQIAEIRWMIAHWKEPST